MVEAGTAAPANTAIKAGTSLGMVAAGTVNGKTVTLTAGAKDIYVVVEAAAGNISAPLKFEAAAYVPPDTTPPMFTRGTINRTSNTAVTTGFNTNESGTLI